MDLTADNFQAFLNAKNMERPCELCLVNNWAMPIISKDKPLQVIDLAARNSSLYLPAYVLYCQNCGNTKLIQASIIEEWSQNRG